MNPAKPKIKPSPILERVTPYHPPRPFAPVSLKLDANEGSLPSPELLDEALSINGEALRKYPDASALEKEIASAFNLPQEKILVTAGADDAIERVLRALLTPEREIVIPVPTFEMFERYIGLADAKAVEIPWLDEKFPLEEVIGAINEKTAILTIVSPNSPTGFVISDDELKKLSAAAPNAIILVDLAYTEFANDDLMDIATSLPNAVVLRSFSKALGLAGIRVGWVYAPQEVIGWLRAVGHPYAVSAPSIQIASAKLKRGKSEVVAFCERIKTERSELTRLLQKLGANPFPSQANFILARFKDAGWLYDALVALGISVRIFPENPYLENCARITLPGNETDFLRLTQALKTIFAPEGLLFDLDNTLADVSESYRKAIIETARFFGVTVSKKAVSQAKAKGNSNNDWELTHRLVKAGGVEVSISAVTEKFEELYQGTAKQKGFRESETLLVKPEFLAALAKRFKLGVVTGRPRKDAMLFLRKSGIDKVFSTVIALEDASPLKPDPAPVKKALEFMKINSAWMVGDTPDDIISARNAMVLPLGVLSLSDEHTSAADAMRRAGAARILKNLVELEELIQ
ncbi:MAG: hypothetical protein Kow0090_11320 [Myxococcota bacterium]